MSRHFRFTDRYTLDANGEPLPCMDREANELYLARERGDDRLTVARDTVNGLRASTVFLTRDHYFGSDPDHAPVLWETMVFPLDSYADLYTDRYTSRAEALAGHARAVEMCRRGEITVEG